MSTEKVCIDRDFISLKKEIYRKTSLDCNQYKDPYLQRRFGVRMRARGVTCYSDYITLLNTDPAECDDMMRDITINVTQFFRDIPVFKALEEEILPLLIYNKITQNAAGPQDLERGVLERRGALHAGDHNQRAAGRGVRSLLGIHHRLGHRRREPGRCPGGQVPSPPGGECPQGHTSRSTSPSKGRCYQLSPEIMEMVEFRNLDLFSATAGSNFDAILCRNVVIYFTKDMQERLYMKFYRALNEGGYFIMGNTETLVGEATKMLTSVKTRERIYQKMSG